MTEYALTKDGVTVDSVRQFKSSPPEFSSEAKSGWAWLPVSRVEGEQAGWFIDNGTAVFSTPAPTPVAPLKEGTFIQFMDELTAEEQLAVKAAALADPVSGLRYDRAMSSNRIDLGSNQMISELQGWVDAGIITSARKAELLAVDFNA